MRTFLASVLFLTNALVGVGAYATTYYDSFGPGQGYIYYGEVLGINKQPWRHQVGFQFTSLATGPVEYFELAIDNIDCFSYCDGAPNSNKVMVTLHTDRNGLVGQEIDSSKFVIRRGANPMVRVTSDYRTTLYKGEKYWIVLRSDFWATWRESTTRERLYRSYIGNGNIPDTGNGKNEIRPYLRKKSRPAAFRVLGPGAEQTIRALD